MSSIFFAPFRWLSVFPLHTNHVYACVCAVNAKLKPHKLFAFAEVQHSNNSIKFT